MNDAVAFYRLMVILLFLFKFAVGAEKSKTIPTEFGNHLWTTARCRASCLTTLKNETTSEQSCARSAQCGLCWDMCMRLEDDKKTYSLVCKYSVLCERGCQTACAVMLQPVKRFQIRGWRFESLPVIDVKKIEGRIRLSWSPPRAPTVDDVTPLVYAIFWQPRNRDAIEPLIETPALFFESTNAHIVFDFDKVIIVAVSPNGPVALVEHALHSRVDSSLSADSPAVNKLRSTVDKSAVSAHSLQTVLLLLALTLFVILNFTLIAFFCCLKRHRALRRANAIRRKTPNKVRFEIPLSKKLSLARRISPFARETHPVNVFSICPMPDSQKSDHFFDSSRLLKTRISSPL
uniref:Uncharacterized protein n=1 Tax=Plectus sambesii TaxID=2011161 RepID=A0A914V5M6_9BILA